MLVLEHAFENEELLPAAVPMRREVALGRVAHDGRSARDLLADAIQHAAFDAGHGRGLPRDAGRVDRGARREVGVQSHCAQRSPFGSRTANGRIAPPMATRERSVIHPRGSRARCPITFALTVHELLGETAHRDTRLWAATRAGLILPLR